VALHSALEENGKMEEDVEPKDGDGVDGRGVFGWDGWVGGLGAVGTSSIFGLLRRSGTFDEVFPTFVLVSRIQFAKQYRVNVHFLNTASSSRCETSRRCPGEGFDFTCRLFSLGDNMSLLFPPQHTSPYVTIREYTL
jgi:hypothetical protein